ncbi:MAG: acyltransferase family protein, partial [Pseudomonadota bacterium]
KPVNASFPRRTDVDGLRGIAVLMVVACHAHAPALPGGFTGVDVFFVVSGYLIAKILSEKHIDLGNFYFGRARRIVPALTVMVVAVLGAGWAVLLPHELTALSESAIATLFFMSNAYFWATSGYFAPEAFLQPLLHTWSLAVEVQFYLLFPLLFLPLVRRGRCILPLLLMTLAAFLLAEVGWRLAATASYFAAPTRAFALLAGALCAVLPARRSGVLATAGLLLILVGAFVVDAKDPYPSTWTLLPVMGTALILVFGNGSTVYRYLSFRPLVAVGVVSFGFYLWHQPLFAFAQLRGDPGPGDFLALAVLALGLGTVSHWCIERPARRWSAQRFSRTFAALGTVGGVVAVAALLTAGGLWRYAPEDRPLAALDPAALGEYVRARFENHERANFADDGRPKTLIIGDSFAEDLVNALHAAGALQAIDLVTAKIATRCGTVWTAADVSAFVEPAWRPKCPPDRGFGSRTALLDAADRILLAAAWRPWQLDFLAETVGNIKLQSNAKVGIVAAKSFGEVDLNALLTTPSRLRGLLRATPDPLAVSTRTALSERRLPVIDLPICPEKHCNLFTPAGALVSHDGDHLTPAGAHDLGRRMAVDGTLERLLGAPHSWTRRADVSVKGRL